MWSTARRELREMLWLISMIGGLSTLTLALAVALAMLLVRVT
jgi:hypothetical protein